MKHSSTRSTRLFSSHRPSKSPTQGETDEERKEAAAGSPEPLQLRPLPLAEDRPELLQGVRLLHPGPCVRARKPRSQLTEGWNWFSEAPEKLEVTPQRCRVH